MANVDGDWAVELNTPIGAQKFDVTIKSDGNSFTGNANGAMGSSDINGTVNGDTLGWSMSVTQPMPVTLEINATVTGDTLAGEAKVGPFGTMKLSGTRK